MERKTNAVILGFLAALDLSACASRKAPVIEVDQPRVGIADLETIPPSAPEPLPKGQKPPPMVLPPEPLSQSPPQYPKSAIEEEISGRAKLLYHVERDGSATLVRLEWLSAVPENHLEAFESAIETAVAGWTFTPARRIVPVTQPDGSIEPEMQPVAQAFRVIVRFRVEDGAGVVE